MLPEPVPGNMNEYMTIQNNSGGENRSSHMGMDWICMARVNANWLRVSKATLRILVDRTLLVRALSDLLYRGRVAFDRIMNNHLLC